MLLGKAHQARFSTKKQAKPFCCWAKPKRDSIVVLHTSSSGFKQTTYKYSNLNFQPKKQVKFSNQKYPKHKKVYPFILKKEATE